MKMERQNNNNNNKNQVEEIESNKIGKRYKVASLNKVKKEVRDTRLRRNKKI